MKWILKHWWLLFVFSTTGNILTSSGTHNIWLVLLYDLADVLALVWMFLIILALVARGIKRLRNQTAN